MKHHGKFSLPKESTLEEFLNIFGMEYCNPLATPMEWNLKLNSVEGNQFENGAMIKNNK